MLRPGGTLAVFDGDYNTISMATSDTDPLQTCADAFIQNFVNDPWVIRRLAATVAAAGLAVGRLRSHGYAQITDAAYMLSVIDRGVDTLIAADRIGPGLGEALKSEASRRAGTLFFWIYRLRQAHRP